MPKRIPWPRINAELALHMMGWKGTDDEYMERVEAFWEARGGKQRYFTTLESGVETKRGFYPDEPVKSPPEQTFGSPLPIQPYSVEISYAPSGTVFVDATMSAFGLKQTLLHYTNLCEEECDQLIVSLDQFGRWEVAGGTGVPQPFILTLTVRK